MDKLNEYRRHIQDILSDHQQVSRSKSDEGVDRQIIIDRERDHYQLLNVGWRNGDEPVFGSPIHISIKGGKIWIERDFTEYGVANELLDRGVPKEDIVLAFYAPYKRPYTEFAAA